MRSGDHEGAARAVNNARADIIREIDPIGAGVAFFERARASRPVVSLLVTGELSSRLRGANGCFHSPVPRLVLAGGGPAAGDDELVAIFASLAGIARRLAPDIGCAFIQVDPKFDSFFRGSPGYAWQGEGGEVDQFLQQVCDEFVFDAYPYQVLGPRHLARLGTTPPGARPLAGGRVELAIGEPSAWLVDQAASEPALGRSFDVPRMDPGIQAAAREILAPCLLRKGESLAFRGARYRAAAAVAAAEIPAPDHPEGQE